MTTGAGRLPDAHFTHTHPAPPYPTYGRTRHATPHQSTAYTTRWQCYKTINWSAYCWLMRRAMSVHSPSSPCAVCT